MGPGRHRHSRGRGRLAPALIGLVALLIQALLPVAAMAAQSPAAGETMVICTQMGVQTVTVSKAGAPEKKGFAGLPCQDCLAAAVALTAIPPIRIERVAYAAAWVIDAPRAELAPRSARAPPRPPGQGPPTA